MFEAGQMTAAEKKKAHKKAWHEANKEKHAATQKAWREANKEKNAATKKAWNEANKEKQAAAQKDWYEANKEKIKANRMAWYEANKEKAKAVGRSRSAARTESISDLYVVHLLRMKNPPAELIEMKREQLEIYRLTKQINSLLEDVKNGTQ